MQLYFCNAKIITIGITLYIIDGMHCISEQMTSERNSIFLKVRSCMYVKSISHTSLDNQFEIADQIVDRMNYQ